MKKILLFLSLGLIALCPQLTAQNVQHTFALGDSAFLLDGKPFQMISGEIHYPRVPREAWRQRMKMAKAMGLNTIGTYVFWNVHEPQKGQYDFKGNSNISEFVKIAQEEGLWVVLRPSPYVCAEWEFGGYPYWLQDEEGLIVRSKNPKYLEAYKKYILQVGKQLSPYLITHGGNILMVQIENEYGSYGSDKEYLAINEKLFREAGFDGILYTCDPAKDVEKGYLPGFLPAVNGTDNPGRVKSIVQKYHNNKGPFYVAEWYPAWFDWWGQTHHTVPAEKYMGRLDTLLGGGLSVNMYMFHGGTTRDFMNGANCYDSGFYEPQISSYDYDAPLDEAGNATDKFMKFRQVIQKHLPANQPLPDVPAAKPSIILPTIHFIETVNLTSMLPKPVHTEMPQTFEALHQPYGFVLYRTKQAGGVNGTLSIKELRDYGIVFVNGKRIGVLDRRLKQDSIVIDLPAGEATIDILVENMGRINFGPNLLKNNKGITTSVSLNGKVLKGWDMYSLPFQHIDDIKFAKTASSTDQPVLKRAYFNLTETGDTYLDMRNWGKGSVWINGHNLGRYWSIGPQQTLYVPVEWLKKGKNEVVVLELLKPQEELSSLSKPVLNERK
ncbi:glycoside hydrolase family 35 protein [Pinibacter aurantiacus]|uniref:Beta-galactosidase n=1 Tax=Pinibacter aurantiacus TaxID=2851599 RepID=A0A9E2SFF6_9BACT|nr:beta-galactosidase [Pinibacter aurantiacus]MBV4359230.1 beta-galactosidase [Pinibacter aurantiacus]